MRAVWHGLVLTVSEPADVLAYPPAFFRPLDVSRTLLSQRRGRKMGFPAARQGLWPPAARPGSAPNRLQHVRHPVRFTKRRRLMLLSGLLPRTADGRVPKTMWKEFLAFGGVRQR